MCVFCKIVAGEIPTEFVYEDEEVVAFSDINPQAPVHILVIPKKHIELAKLEKKDEDLIKKLVIVAKKIAKDKGISDSGFRLIFNSGSDAGQEVKHIHLHLLGGKKLGPMISR